ncbi:MAG: serine/threonine protein kinase [Lentisphaeraceae bacterium]|nr:serine/threonine protein kinase [Lentisphaeraceae bacterium]
MSIFKTIFGGANKSTAKYEKLIYPCKSCNKKISLKELSPLSMSYCPKCNDLFLVPCKLGEWWVIEPLGSGGMGAVYLGEHSSLASKKSAVKILHDSGDIQGSHLETLIEEAKIASTFGQHSNLSEIYTYNNDGKRAYMIMSLVEGQRLDLLISQSEQGISTELVLYYMLDILSALAHIYSCGYLYRDLKLENIIITPAGSAVLVDYGLCMTLDEAWNNDQEDIMGSPLYMPPERIGGRGEDFRADFYSLGMVMYHCLQGKPYFSQTEINKLVRQQLDGPRLPTAFKLKGKDKSLIKLIDKLIHVDRKERFADYEELYQDIYKILNILTKEKTACVTSQKRRKILPKKAP